MNCAPKSAPRWRRDKPSCCREGAKSAFACRCPLSTLAPAWQPCHVRRRTCPFSPLLLTMFSSVHLSHEIAPMRSRGSESLIVLALLPIFFVGAFPMLLLTLLGFAGLVIFGILMISVGFTDALEANSSF